MQLGPKIDNPLLNKMAAAVIRHFNGQEIHITDLWLVTPQHGFALVNGIWCRVGVNCQLVPCFGGREVRIELVGGHEIHDGMPLPPAIECYITSPDEHTSFHTFDASAEAENDSFQSCFNEAFARDASDDYADLVNA